MKSVSGRSGPHCADSDRTKGLPNPLKRSASTAANSAGASSPIICCSTFRTRPSSRSGKSSPTFPGNRTESNLRAWQRGRTGYPIVDAGMRELWHTGWMHNRVRMIVASFLVKDLLIPWQEGAAWFWDTLVDADLANNTLGWQWTAGCGADAAPYFRIFNPVTQGEKFDPQGDYVRHWVPELNKLPSEWVHKPWEAPARLLADAGIELGSTYPLPIVDHREARSRALEALQRIKK